MIFLRLPAFSIAQALKNRKMYVGIVCGMMAMHRKQVDTKYAW
jgi:hypothetical protein